MSDLASGGAASRSAAEAAFAQREERLRKGVGGKWSPAGLAWSLFEFARNPYYMLVVVFVFPSYFSQAVIGDPVKGQAVIAGAIGWAGIVCALTAPLLGAIMDRGGRRMPLMAFFLAMVSLCAFSLWWVKPGAGGLGVAEVVPILVVAYSTYTYSEVMHNAMLHQAGRADALSEISGLGLGLGQLGASFCLIAFLIASLFRDQLGISREAFHLERSVGPFAAVWLAVFAIPFFLFVPDGKPADGSWGRATRAMMLGETGFNPVKRVLVFVRYLRSLVRDYPRIMHYLFARIIYADGVTAVLSLGGVYTAGVLGWSLPEILLYAIWGTFWGFVGGVFVVGRLDNWLGPRRAIIAEVSFLCLAVTLAVSVTKTSILFGLIPVTGVLHGGALFNTLSDVFYLGVIAMVSMAAVSCISSSRSFLVRIAPKERISEFFGLYMISATATVWLGPMLTKIVTEMSGDQRIGFSPILGILFVGLALMLTVPADTGEPDAGAETKPDAAAH
ncbi:MAG: MFS transporter [Hyphomonadaceae bacterium]